MLLGITGNRYHDMIARVSGGLPVGRLLSCERLATVVRGLRHPFPEYRSLGRGRTSIDDHQRGTGFHIIARTLAFQSSGNAHRMEKETRSTLYNPEVFGRVVKGVVFDMDGTLTVPCIDFQEMRRRVGIEEGDILHVIHGWPEEQQKEAFRKIAEIEEEALENLQIMPGAVELCSLLDSARMPRALVTRNVSASVQFFHDTAFPLPPFHPSLSREWKPYKPDPASLHYIAEYWNVGSDELVMIGDSAKDDIVCGNAAGAVTILLDQRGLYQCRDDPSLRGARPDFIVNSLHEASRVLHDYLQIQAQLGG